MLARYLLSFLNFPVKIKKRWREKYNTVGIYTIRIKQERNFKNLNIEKNIEKNRGKKNIRVHETIDLSDKLLSRSRLICDTLSDRAESEEEYSCLHSMTPNIPSKQRQLHRRTQSY